MVSSSSTKRKSIWKRKYNLGKADMLFVLLMIAIPLTHFCVFTLYINFDAIAMSFTDVSYKTNSIEFVGLAHYKKFFIQFGENNVMLKAILNSLGYFPVTVFIMLPLSIFAAYFLYRKVLFHNAYKIIFFLPSVISIVVLALVFRNMFDATIGPVNWILVKLGVPSENIPNWLVDPKYSMNILYLYAIWAGIGYNVVLLFGAMSRVPMEVVESGRLDGVGTLREIVQIFVPLIWPTVSTMIIFGVTTVFAQYIHPMVLTQGGTGETWTVALIIINQVTGGSMYYAAALGIMLAVIATPTVQFFKWLTGKIMDTVEM